MKTLQFNVDFDAGYSWEIDAHVEQSNAFFRVQYTDGTGGLSNDAHLSDATTGVMRSPIDEPASDDHPNGPPPEGD